MQRTFSYKHLIITVLFGLLASMLFGVGQASAHHKDWHQIPPGHSASKIEQRIEKHLERIEKRKQKIQDRICDRMERIQDRYDRKGYPINLSLPSFCDGEDDLEPPTVDIDADPMEIESGESTKISWSSEYADSCEGSDGLSGDVGTSGDMDVSPTESTTYTVTCLNDDGEDSDSVTVTVTDPQIDPPTLSIVADPLEITEGESSTLTWDSENADTCIATDGEGDWPGDKPLDGSEEVSPTEDTTYTLNCENAGGQTEKMVTVTVIQIDPPTVSLEADPLEITEGESTTLSWTSTGADTCTATVGWTGARGLNGDEVVSPTETTSYTITCENEAGEDSDSVEVTVNPVEETLDHVIISEVYYDVDGNHGGETLNEWVELYNPTDSDIDMTDWTVGDLDPDVTLPASTIIAAGGYMIITDATDTMSFWTNPAGVPIVTLGTAINTSGLSNSGDSLFLRDASAATVDSVSWVGNTDALDPAAIDVDEGNSLYRSDLTVDTDTAADWSENTTPSPGE